MTDTELLKKAIRDSGIKVIRLMEASNIKAYATFRSKMNNQSEFTASEIKAICAALKFTAADRDRVFFAKDV